MWEQVKRAMAESAREVGGSVRVWGRNPKSVWWNDKVKAAIKRELEMKMQENSFWKSTKEKRERLKGLYVKAKRRFRNSLEGR